MLAAEGRVWAAGCGTGLDGQPNDALNLIRFDFIPRLASGESDDVQHAGALSTPVQAGG